MRLPDHTMDQITGTIRELQDKNALVAFTDSLYERFFELSPSSRGLFQKDMAAQKRAMASMFLMLAERVKDPEAGSSFDEDALVAHHSKLDVPPETFSLLLEAIGHAFTTALDRPLSDGERRAWEVVYWQLASRMIEGNETYTDVAWLD